MSMALMNAFHDLDRSEARVERYYASQVYSTAADLTDGMLKGGGAEGPQRLHNALIHNRDRQGILPEEYDAWDFAAELVADHFGLV